MSTTPESSEVGERSEADKRLEVPREVDLVQAAGLVLAMTPALLLVEERENHLQLTTPASPRRVREGIPHSRARLTVVEREEGRESPTMTSSQLASSSSSCNAM